MAGTHWLASRKIKKYKPNQLRFSVLSAPVLYIPSEFIYNFHQRSPTRAEPLACEVKQPRTCQICPSPFSLPSAFHLPRRSRLRQWKIIKKCRSLHHSYTNAGANLHHLRTWHSLSAESCISYIRGTRDTQLRGPRHTATLLPLTRSQPDCSVCTWALFSKQITDTAWWRVPVRVLRALRSLNGTNQPHLGPPPPALGSRILLKLHLGTSRV